MTKLVMRKALGVLTPVDEDAREALARVKLGKDVLVEVKQPRNLKHHRWWWKLMSVVAENMPGDLDPELVCDVIKIRIGHCHAVNTRSGMTYIPKSISFASMDETKFRDFTDRAIRFICIDILPQMDDEALRRQVDDMLGPAQPPRYDAEARG